jgi:transposase
MNNWRAVVHRKVQARFGGGRLKKGAKRTSSAAYPTHVLAAIRDLHRLENVGETLRQALNHLASRAPDWLRQHAEVAWAKRYGCRIEQYRLPKAEAERQALALAIGQDGYTLLSACLSPTAPDVVRNEPAVETLRRVWLQQYYRCDDPTAPELRWRAKTEQPPCAQLISSPYDPDARYKTKRDTSWVGYKVHLTETCDDDSPNLITHVATTAATTADGELTATIHSDLAKKHLLPREHYLDIGYVDAQILVDSQTEHDVRVVGPVITDPAWQAHTPQGITISQFALDWDAQQATCPQGKVSRTWSPALDAHDNEMVVIRFHPDDCTVCSRQADCTQAKRGARTISIRTRPYHEAIQAARAQQQTREFRAEYARRAGVEGTFAQGNHLSDLRHARYLGQAKVHLQHLITAIALNLLRAIAWLRETPRAQTRTSAFAALMTQPS